MIDHEKFLAWAESRFGKENIKIRGREICTHSVFAEDYKYHLWMNPYGGKEHRPGGAFRCWYSNRSGSLISLVAELDKISYDEAEDMICTVTSLATLERRIEEFFNNQTAVEPQDPSKPANEGLQLPPYTYKIDDMSAADSNRIRARGYLSNRQIPSDGLYVCVADDYRNRIVIPYYDIYDNLIYYNARTMSNSKKVLRFMKPKEKGVEQNQVLFCRNWPRPDSKIHLTEGEFDAISLDVCGFHGIACGGKSLSESQIEMLRAYVPVLSFDRDEDSPQDWGLLAMVRIGKQLLEKGFEDVRYVRPPKGFKDWNALLQKKSEDLIHRYVEAAEQPFTAWTADVMLQLQKI